jgi:hypothetical protein
VVADLLRTVRVLVRELVAARSAPPTPQTARRASNAAEEAQEPILGSDDPKRTLTGRAVAILTVLEAAEKPLKQASIARRCQLRFNSYFRGVFSELRARDLVVEVEGPDDSGWWLTSRPMPEGCRERPKLQRYARKADPEIADRIARARRGQEQEGPAPSPAPAPGRPTLDELAERAAAACAARTSAPAGK